MTKQRATRTDLYSEVVTYTPALATEMLERGGHNRYLSSATVAKYAAIMKRGGWRADNGEAVKLDRQGVVKDGQHRLWAVVESGETVRMYTTFNVAEDCFDTLDTGKPRRGPDICSILGVKNYNLVASALTMCFREEEGDITSSRAPDNDMIEGLLERHPSVRQSVDNIMVARCKTRGQKGLFPYGLAAYLHYKFAQKDRVMADRFFWQMYTGDELKRADPVWNLRDRCLSDMVSTTKMPRIHKAALAVKAWNATRAGTSVKNLRWSDTEEFPAIK
jgi:hypothetical protein